MDRTPHPQTDTKRWVEHLWKFELTTEQYMTISRGYPEPSMFVKSWSLMKESTHRTAGERMRSCGWSVHRGGASPASPPSCDMLHASSLHSLHIQPICHQTGAGHLTLKEDKSHALSAPKASANAILVSQAVRDVADSTSAVFIHHPLRSGMPLPQMFPCTK